MATNDLQSLTSIPNDCPPGLRTLLTQMRNRLLQLNKSTPQFTDAEVAQLRALLKSSSTTSSSSSTA